MDPMSRILIRAAKWTRKPPSLTTVLILAAMVALFLILAAVEMYWGWPEWLTVNDGPSRGVPRIAN